MSNQLYIFLCFVLALVSTGESFWFRRPTQTYGTRDAVNPTANPQHTSANQQQIQPQLMYDSVSGQFNMAVPVSMSGSTYSVIAQAAVTQQPQMQQQSASGNTRDVQMMPIQFLPCVCMPAPTALKEQTPPSHPSTPSPAVPIESNPPTEAYRSLAYLEMNKK